MHVRCPGPTAQKILFGTLPLQKTVSHEENITYNTVQGMNSENNSEPGLLAQLQPQTDFRWGRISCRCKSDP